MSSTSNLLCDPHSQRGGLERLVLNVASNDTLILGAMWCNLQRALLQAISNVPDVPPLLLLRVPAV